MTVVDRGGAARHADDGLTHRLRLTRRRLSLAALCSCGWASPPTSTAGLAGSLFDAHVENGSSA